MEWLRRHIVILFQWPISFFVAFQTFSVGFKFGLFPGQSSNVAFLVEACRAFNNWMCIS